MDNDFLFVFGILAVLASAPGLLNAFSRGDKPGVWAVLAIAGFGLIAVVLVQNPNTYTFENFPATFGRVFSEIF